MYSCGRFGKNDAAGADNSQRPVAPRQTYQPGRHDDEMTAVIRFAPTFAKARLHDIHDRLTLALDVTEPASGYTRTEREARSHIRSALRQTTRLMEVGNESLR